MYPAHIERCSHEVQKKKKLPDQKARTIESLAHWYEPEQKGIEKEKDKGNNIGKYTRKNKDKRLRISVCGSFASI